MRKIHITFKVVGLSLILAAVMTACDNEIPEIQQPLNTVDAQVVDVTNIKAQMTKRQDKNKKTDEKKDKKTLVRTTVKF